MPTRAYIDLDRSRVIGRDRDLDQLHGYDLGQHGQCRIQLSVGVTCLLPKMYRVSLGYRAGGLSGFYSISKLRSQMSPGYPWCPCPPSRPRTLFSAPVPLPGSDDPVPLSPASQPLTPHPRHGHQVASYLSTWNTGPRVRIAAIGTEGREGTVDPGWAGSQTPVCRPGRAVDPGGGQPGTGRCTPTPEENSPLPDLTEPLLYPSFIICFSVFITLFHMNIKYMHVLL